MRVLLMPLPQTRARRLMSQKTLAAATIRGLLCRCERSHCRIVVDVETRTLSRDTNRPINPLEPPSHRFFTTADVRAVAASAWRKTAMLCDAQNALLCRRRWRRCARYAVITLLAR
jgi:hypothetical protein